MAVTDVSEVVSAAILEHADPDRIQASLKNNWTNAAVISALLFGIVAGYAQPKSSSMSLREFPGGQFMTSKLGFDANEKIQYFFFYCSILSFIEYLVAILLATIHLMWTDSLSPEDMKQYHKDNPSAPAAPLMWHDPRHC